jgi:hypothetical protein
MTKKTLFNRYYINEFLTLTSQTFSNLVYESVITTSTTNGQFN